jgi:hypothetical protein
MFSLLNLVSTIWPAFLLLSCLTLIGFACWFVVGLDRPRESYSLETSFLSGVLLLSAVTWYGTKVGLSAQQCFGLVLFGTLVLLWLVAIKGYLLDALICVRDAIAANRVPTACLVVAMVCSSSVLLMAIRDSDLPIISNGNGDVLVYLKTANYILHGSQPSQVGGTDLAEFARVDAYGSFVLLSFTSFLANVNVIAISISLIALASSMLVFFISKICVQIYQLCPLHCLLIGILIQSSTLICIEIYSYYLSQLIFAAVFLGVVAIFLESAKNSCLTFRKVMIVSIIAANVILIFYEFSYLPSIAILAGIASWLQFAASDRPSWREIAYAASRFACYATLCIVSSAILFPARLGYLGAYLKTASRKSIGWPGSFVEPGIMMGLPVNWDERATYDVSLAKAMILPIVCACVLALLVRNAVSRRDAFIAATPVIAFLGSYMLYLLVWSIYGYSYQQWKFAGSFPIIFGFSVSACGLASVYTKGSRFGRQIVNYCGAAILLLLIMLNGSLISSRWGANIVHFSRNLSAADEINSRGDVGYAIVILPDMLERMAAAIFINTKVVLFDGPTYYAHTSVRAPSSDDKILVFSRTNECTDEPAPKVIKYAIYESTFERANDVTLPNLKPGDRFRFSQDVSGCIQSRGLGQPEGWGRWTEDKRAEIVFRCRCQNASGSVVARLYAGALLYPTIRERQVAVFKVNGVVSQRVIFDTSAPRHIDLALPEETLSGGRITIEIETPNSISPSESGSPDIRVLGLSLVEFELLDRPQ